MRSRRELLLSAGALALAGCATPCPPPATTVAGTTAILIDGHCHLFNVSDLSAVRFLSWVVLKHYPPLEPGSSAPGVAALSPPQDADWEDDLMTAVLYLAGAEFGPSAETELDLLQHSMNLAPKPVDPDSERAAAIRRAADLLGGKSFAKHNPRGEDRLRLLILHAGGGEPERGALALAAKPPQDRMAIAERAFSENGVGLQSFAEAQQKPALGQLYLPGLLTFVIQLKRYRHCLVDQLTEIHRGAGLEPKLLVPAMVDFGRWLREEPDDGSTFAVQTKVWHVISNRSEGPAVHGYVAYCPLRQVEFERGLLGARIPTRNTQDPLEVVKTALTERGFLGVKLYPPMGFRASGNASRGAADHPMPVKVLEDVFGDPTLTDAARESRTAMLGGLLDDALARLWAVCTEYGAPVMAHGGNSVDASCHAGELADPYYWKPVFDLATPPSVMLAHFGGFSYRSADPATGSQPTAAGKSCETNTDPVPFEDTWEAWLVKYMAAHPAKPVFTDLSYFAEILRSGSLDVLRAHFLALGDDRLAVLRDRLVFGTDWVMLAKEPNVPRYSALVRGFVASVFDPLGAHPEYVENIMHRNFLRYAGLARGSQAFDRLTRSYGGNPVLTERLAAVCSA